MTTTTGMTMEKNDEEEEMDLSSFRDFEPHPSSPSDETGVIRWRGIRSGSNGIYRDRGHFRIVVLLLVVMGHHSPFHHRHRRRDAEDGPFLFLLLSPRISSASSRPIRSTWVEIHHHHHYHPPHHPHHPRIVVVFVVFVVVVRRWYHRSVRPSRPVRPFVGPVVPSLGPIGTTMTTFFLRRRNRDQRYPRDLSIVTRPPGCSYHRPSPPWYRRHYHH